MTDAEHIEQLTADRDYYRNLANKPNGSPIGWYIFAALSVFIFVGGSLLTLELYRPGGQWNSNVTQWLIGSGGVTLTGLMIIIQQWAAANKQIEATTRNAARLDHLHECVEHRTKEVKQEALEARKVASDTYKEVLKIQTGGKEVHVSGKIEVEGQGD